MTADPVVSGHIGPVERTNYPTYTMMSPEVLPLRAGLSFDVS